MGFPTQKIVFDRFKKNDQVVFLAVQTVFEGHVFNTMDKLPPTQEKFDLPIFMGHDVSKHSKAYPIPTTMFNYRTGGTPWVVIIDQNGIVVFNHFHIEESQATRLITELLNN